MIRSTLLATTAALFLAPMAHAQSAHVDADGAPFAVVATADQAVTYANLQNLVARWNNVVVQAETGAEQLGLMLESGVFADDFRITFNTGAGEPIVLEGLDNDAARAFYGQVVDGVGSRLNLATNVELLGFTEDGATARFKYLAYVDGAASWGGTNEVEMGMRDGRPVMLTSEIFLSVTANPALSD